MTMVKIKTVFIFMCLAIASFGAPPLIGPGSYIRPYVVGSFIA